MLTQSGSCRLDVLRVFLAAADGAIKAKPSSMRSESQVLALLAKQAKSNKAAAAEFELAKRDDLRKKEEAQLAVLNEYINLLPTVPETEYAEAVTKILANLKANGAKLHYGVCVSNHPPSPSPHCCFHCVDEHTLSLVQIFSTHDAYGTPRHSVRPTE